MNYIPRIIDSILNKKLELYGAILIAGPKWCGKSTTAKQFAKSVLEFQNPKTRENDLQIASTRPDLLLEGDKPRLIDEWQDAPSIWDAIRYDVDNSGLKNQYILTGSNTPRNEEPKHTGTGRIVKLTMRPMSLYESNDSTGEVSLEKLFEGDILVEGKSTKELEDIAFLCSRGGWPNSIGLNEKDSLSIARDYYESLIDNDITKVIDIEKNPTRLRNFFRSYARNICTSASINTILNDIVNGGGEISDKTISNYINGFEKLYIIDDVLSWCPKLRSKTLIRTTPKRCLVDPSLAVVALRATTKDLLKDFNTFGFIFESLCLRDLKIYAQSLDGEVYYYRDKTDLECDAVIHLQDGRWGAIEIKIGSNEGIEEASKNLLKLANIVDDEEMNKPSFLMVLTAGKYAYRREDGIFVVPITTLKP